MRGVSFSVLSDQTGLHISSLGHSLRRCIPAANSAIAAFLEKPLHELWPQWFDADGNRLPGAGALNNKARINRRPKRLANTDRGKAA